MKCFFCHEELSSSDEFCPLCGSVREDNITTDSQGFAVFKNCNGNTHINYSESKPTANEVKEIVKSIIGDEEHLRGDILSCRIYYFTKFCERNKKDYDEYKDVVDYSKKPLWQDSWIDIFTKLNDVRLKFLPKLYNLSDCYESETDGYKKMKITEQINNIYHKCFEKMGKIGAKVEKISSLSEIEKLKIDIYNSKQPKKL